MPDVDLTLNEVQLKLLGTSIPMDNLQVSIEPYGLGLTFTTEIEVSIAAGTSADIQVSIAEPTIADPTDAYGVHLGQGAVLIQWQHPTHELVAHYEVLASSLLAGPYVPYHRGESLLRHVIVENIPMGAPPFFAYFKVRAYSIDGAVSNLVQVKQGCLEKPLVTLAVTGIVGSQIPKDAIFTSVDKETGLLIALACNDLIVIA